MSFANPSATHRILDQVWDERDRQDLKWGPNQAHPFIALGVSGPRMTEFYDLPTVDMAKERCDRRHKNGIGTWVDILIEEVCEAVDAFAQASPAEARVELVQVAAVAVAIVEAIDRDGAG